MISNGNRKRSICFNSEFWNKVTTVWTSYARPMENNRLLYFPGYYYSCLCIHAILTIHLNWIPCRAIHKKSSQSPFLEPAVWTILTPPNQFRLTHGNVKVNLAPFWSWPVGFKHIHYSGLFFCFTFFLQIIFDLQFFRLIEIPTMRRSCIFLAFLERSYKSVKI